ncbi:MAG: HNH endonuclease [Bacteroidota bacterium]
MTKKVKLKNAEEYALLDEKTYKFLSSDRSLKKVDFVNNLRRHSSGCAVFQKVWPNKKGDGYVTETIYLHRFIAEKFLGRQKSRKNNLVGAKNGNKLDCRLENLEWRSRSIASRRRRTTSKTGYTGVYQENNKYRAVISIDRKTVHIGMYVTPEEAAMAYNKYSRILFGDKGKLNIIKQK